MKLCPHCHLEKELSEFYKDKSHKDGLQSYCKVCNDEKKKEYIRTSEKRRRKANQTHRLWCLRNKERVKQNKKEYYYKNREGVLLQAKQWKENHSDYNRLWQKQYRARQKRAKAKLAQPQRCKHLLLLGTCSLCAGVPQQGAAEANLGIGLEKDLELFEIDDDKLDSFSVQIEEEE